MDVNIKPEQLKNLDVEAISSKSVVHRYLIAASLCKEKVRITTNIFSKDMESTCAVLNEAGADISQEANAFCVNGMIQKGNRLEANFKESGSTGRFLLPLLTCFYDETLFEGEGRLTDRPFFPLCEALRKGGVEVQGDYLPIRTKGHLSSGDFRIAGDVSSQFISGLLFTLPLLDGDSRILLSSPLCSAPYVDMTIKVLSEFGVLVERISDGFYIPGNQQYTSPGDIIAEGDWSNSAYLLGIGALSGKAVVRNLSDTSLQGDKAIIDLLKRFGAFVDKKTENNIICYEVAKRDLKGIDIDISDIPDLALALSVLGASANGTTVLYNAERLRLKESDRIKAIEYLLNAIGVECRIEKKDNHENIVIKGCPNKEFVHGIEIDSLNDHRIVMAAVMICAYSGQEIIIHNAEAINKSFPGFWDIFR